MSPRRPRIHIACSREGIFFLFFVLGLGGAAIYTAKNSLILLFCFLVFTLIATLYIGRSNVSRLHLDRRFQDELFANQEAHIDLLAKNTGKHTRYALHLYEDFDQDRTIGPIFVPSLKPEETVQTPYDCIFYERGSVRFRQIQVRSRFPLPFFEFRAIYPCETRNTVYPARDTARDMITYLKETASPQGRTLQRHTRLQELEHGHQRGHIQWKLSARRNTFIEQVDHSTRHHLTQAIDFKPRSALSASDFERQISQITDDCMNAFQEDRTVIIHTGANVVPSHRKAILEFLANA